MQNVAQTLRYSCCCSALTSTPVTEQQDKRLKMAAIAGDAMLEEAERRERERLQSQGGRDVS